MGRGNPSLVLPLYLPENSGACTLVWNHGFELHVCVEVPQAEQAMQKDRTPLILKCRFLIPSRIYALARPGVVGGQTRPNVV